MNLKTELIRAAVRILSDNTSFAPKPDVYQSLIADLFGLETQEDRLVREIDEATQKMIATAKQMNTNRKFKKIVQNV